MLFSEVKEHPVDPVTWLLGRWSCQNFRNWKLKLGLLCGQEWVGASCSQFSRINCKVFRNFFRLTGITLAGCIGHRADVYIVGPHSICEVCLFSHPVFSRWLQICYFSIASSLVPNYRRLSCRCVQEWKLESREDSGAVLGLGWWKEGMNK